MTDEEHTTAFSWWACQGCRDRTDAPRTRWAAARTHNCPHLAAPSPARTLRSTTRQRHRAPRASVPPDASPAAPSPRVSGVASLRREAGTAEPGSARAPAGQRGDASRESTPCACAHATPVRTPPSALRRRNARYAQEPQNTSNQNEDPQHLEARTPREHATARGRRDGGARRAWGGASDAETTRT
ncbi:hypothetical protein CERSUDRAFT_94932 [Gelatoporia subvermispora B]|uniref:Uncharacterized protein n=1 Tax=Ceriporiopsis subvermispora (strain B) TaxID=914234 RepID=M2QWY6_CERS8|nr:hypothetical protein CERSUDRAFT_94932 [Gelatoporia subvermispora B]